MPLIVHRSNRAEKLIDALAGNLADPGQRPRDPFAEVPIVVGSRGMARWIKHQIATRRGVAARLAFPFPRPALDGAAALLLGEPGVAEPFWGRSALDGGWEAGALSWRLIDVIRRRLAAPVDGQDALARVRRYLGAADATQGASLPVSARELGFAQEVASALDELSRVRPELALAWLDAPAESDPGIEPQDRWLALLLRDLAAGLATGGSARRLEKLGQALAAGGLDVPAGPRGPEAVHLHIFGLSTLQHHELRLLALVSQAPHLHFHLYLLAPSAMWLQDHATRAEVAARLSAAQSYEAQRAIIDLREASHPLLSDLGRPSRDVQALLESLAPHHQEPVPADAPQGLFEEPTGEGVLARLQRDLLWARAPSECTDPAERAIDVADASLTFHPCHGALRQVEVLRGELLAAFAADPSLEPRQVLVMTPDIATFAPLVAAVFGEEGRGEARRDPRTGRWVTRLPAIPVEIADLGLRATNAVAEVLLAVLEMAGERLTLGAILELLNLGPVQTRFGLSAQDASALQQTLVAAGVRWGVDADDRAGPRGDRPRLHQNSLAFGMERVALGALFLDETDRDDDLPASAAQRVLSSSLPSAGDDASTDFVPFDAQSGEDFARFGRFSGFIGALLHHRAQLAEPAPIAVWRARLDALLQDLTATSDASAWLAGRVNEELDALAREAAQADFEAPVGLDALRSLLQGRFDLPRSGDRLITGAVTVCALEPMRSVPFKLVALLGLDDGAFPRIARRRAWDPLARARRAGEHDRRDIDRHLLLESLLSARERVMVFWSGFDVHTGETVPAAVPVRELMDALDARFDGFPDARGRPQRPSQALTLPGALQPWSEPCFRPLADRVARALSYDSPMLDGARKLRALRQGGQAPRPAVIEAGGLGALGEDGPPDGAWALDIGTLANDLAGPCKVLLKGRLQLRLKDDGDLLPEREPLDITNLDAWSLRERALGLALAADDPDLAARMARRLRAEGWLPIGPSGVGHVDQHAGEAIALEAVVAAELGQPPGRAHAALTGRDLTLSLADPNGGVWALSAQAVAVADDPQSPGHQQLVISQAGQLKGKTLLKAWLHLLAAVCARPSPPISGAQLVCHGGAGKPATTQWLRAPGPDEAEAQLLALLRLWRQARRGPLPLFAGLSYDLALTLLQEGAGLSWSALTPALRASLRAAARDGWNGREGWGGDGDDVWVAAVYGVPDFDEVLPEPQDDAPDAPEPEWVAVARAVWTPLLGAMGRPEGAQAPTQPDRTEDGGRP